MKKMLNKMSNTVKAMTCKAHCAMSCTRARLSESLSNTRGEGYIDTLFGDTVLPTVTQRVEDMFNYAG